jgi:hypothetical protein
LLQNPRSEAGGFCYGGVQRMKVFWFFFAKKNCFLFARDV